MGQSEEDYFFFVYECLYVCWSFFFMLYTVDWYHLTSLVIFRVPEIRVYQVLWDTVLIRWVLRLRIPDPSLGIIQLLYLIFLHMFKNCITTCVLYRIWVKKQITLLFFCYFCVHDYCQERTLSFTSLKEDLLQDTNGHIAFNLCQNGTCPWRKCSVKALVS